MISIHIDPHNEISKIIKQNFHEQNPSYATALKITKIAKIILFVLFLPISLITLTYKHLSGRISHEIDPLTISK